MILKCKKTFTIHGDMLSDVHDCADDGYITFSEHEIYLFTVKQNKITYFVKGSSYWMDVDQKYILENFEQAIK